MKYLTLTLCIFMLSGCSVFGPGERDDLKSPCVGIEGSPCAEQKRDVNAWWLT